MKIIKRFLASILLIAATAAIAAVVGCTHIKQNITTELSGTNEVRRTTTMSATTFFDSKQSVEKLRMSNGKTQAIGVTGFDQEANGSNSVRSLEVLSEIIRALPK